MNDALLYRIGPVTRRFRSVRFWRLFAVAAFAVGLIGWFFKGQVDRGQVAGSFIAMLLLGVVLAVGLVVAVVCRLSFRDPRTVATRIESRFPDLDQRLLTALSQKDNELGYLQQRVIKEARDHSRAHRWIDAVPRRELVWSRLSGFAATAFLAAILGLLAISNPISPEQLGASRIDAIAGAIVEPGNTEVERGTSLVITARFAAGMFPGKADLICHAEDGSERQITMTQSLDDPIVGGFVASIDQPFDYQVVSPGWQSERYHIDVFDFPALVRSDAHLKYPDYTGLPEKRIEDTVRVSAVEGTAVTWTCFLNKSVASAELVGKDGTRIALNVSAESPAQVSTTLSLTETQRFKLELVDQAGRTNKYPPELVARVLPNQPPSLKLTVAGDVSVSPLEELPIEAEVRDDFGIKQVGLSFTFADHSPQEITLASDLAGGAKTNLQHLIEFEKLNAEPDQLLAYHFWVDDYGPDGQLRRTESDMYFAEVRPFEEIMREGEQPPGGESQSQQQSQNGQQAEQLAELQKEIINATWRVIRNERGKDRSEDFSENVKLLIESQANAVSQLEELALEVQDAQSKQYIDEVRKQMQTALAELTKAGQAGAVAPLNPAMVAEQSAYGGLLKLRAREFQVTRSRRQQNQNQSSSASRQRRQQQLDELELDQDENRYETQRQAQESPEDQQQREVRQVLNRLRELARRQADLNKELAQLQSALEKAQTEKEQDEIERQLKRLRDQQQDLLRETDELSERMQSPENQEQMAEASEKLEETRENVRSAAEALQEKDAAAALTSGKRAEREFEEMRDEFRAQAAGQFNDAVRELRNDAQQLDEQQKAVAEELRQLDQPQQSAGLRGGNDRQQVEEKLEQQSEQLRQLLQQMQETVEEAETAEPLLAQKLYDSFRKAGQRQVDRQLQETAELLRRGFDPQAREAERGASEGIGQLREELEEAAASVLGDETKALQRALGELEQLERELESELQRNDPRRAAGQGSQDEDPSRSAAGQQSQPGAMPEPSSRSRSAEQDGSREQSEPQQPAQGSPADQPAQQRDPTAPQSDPQRPQQGQPGGEPSQPNESPQSQPQPTPQGQGGGEPPQPGEQQPGQSGQPSQSGQREQQSPQGQASQSESPNQRDADQRGGLLSQFASENPNQNAAAAPLTGDGFRDWSDRLREVEEMVDDPELRSQAARIRDRARDVRIDYRRNSKEPEWDLVDKMIAEPLRELKRNVSEELLRRSAEKHAPVPIDRDPVPNEFVDAVRKYYESLGSGR